ncbi:MAG TPA: hypothetical protein VJL81_09675 [Solirubrobacterales bacterium]|nr:hypothetical protein [Solirubrobacterales bacterium]
MLPRQPRSAIGEGVVFVVIVLAALAASAPAALGAARTFEQRFEANDTGDITLVGNTVLTCPAANPQCAAAQAGTASGAALNNNAYTMGYVNQDPAAPPGVFDSSSADLSLPAGATVLKAMLYFGGDSGAGVGGAPPPNAAARNTVLLKTPGSAIYLPLSASQLDFITTDGNDYQGAVDVTSEVGSGGSGACWVANVQAGTGQDRDAGWSLVVAYRDTSEPPRNLAIFDGFQIVNSGNPNVGIGVSGFRTPPSGPVRTKLGFVAYEGDAGSTGDSVKLDTTKLSDASNPLNNFFNSAISHGGAAFTAKVPNYLNQLGYDSILANADGVLANGETSAAIRLTTGGETYFPGVVTFATELFAPEVLLSKSVTDLNGGQVEPGDTLRYTVTATNSGPDDATSVVLSDPIPSNTTYLPGSLKIDGVAKGDTFPGTDEAGFDEANNRAVFWLGSGAAAERGGSLAAGGGTTTASFDVTVGTVPAGTEITNTAHADFFARTLGVPLAADSDAVSSTVAAPDLTIAKTPASFTAVGGGKVEFALTVTNSGTAPTDGSQVTVTDPLLGGASKVFEQLDAVAGTGWTCTPPTPAPTPVTISCQRTAPAALPAGASYPPIAITATVAEPPPAGAIANTARVEGGGDADPSDNSSTSVGQATTRADLQISKTVEPTTALTDEAVTFTLTVRNGGPSAAQNVAVDDSPPLPGSFALESAAASQGSCPTPTHCDLGSLAAGGEATVTVKAIVTASGAGVVGALNSATVSSATTDPDPSNDTSSAEVSVAPTADLSITKTATPSPLDTAAPAQYTLTVHNNGPQVAANSVLTDPLPTGFIFVSAAPSQGTCEPPGAGGTLRCALGAIASGANATVAVDGTLAASAAGTLMSNTALIGSDTGDPNPANDSATASSVVIPAADLELTKVVAAGEAPNPGEEGASKPVKPGEEVTFTLEVTNHGPGVALNAAVTDPFPAGLSLVSAPGCTAAAGTVTCAVGSLAGGASQSFQLKARVDDSLAGREVTNFARATSSTPDPLAANGVDAASLSVAPESTSSPSSTTAAATAAGQAPEQKKHHRHHHQKRKPKAPNLVVEKVANTAFARPSGIVGYRITVSNRGDGDARNVKVCDDPPLEQKTLRTDPAVANQSAPCWHLSRLAAGKVRVFRLTAQVEGDSASGVQRNRAIVSAANMKGRRADSAAVRVRPLPETACGSRLARPALPLAILPRC